MPRSNKPSLLPPNPTEWRTRAEKIGVLGKSIHAAELKSASKMTERQYLLLQVLWKTINADQFNWEYFELKPWENEAEKLLQAYPCWRKYCESLAQGPRAAVCTSTFAVPQELQRHAAVTDSPMSASISRLANLRLGDTPSKSTGTVPTYPDDDDDEEGDGTMITFLMALTLHSGLGNKWSIHRCQLKAEFPSAFFEARTDGYLVDKWCKKKIRALIEVKAVRRSESIAMSVRMEEAAQMVAWIKQHPDHNGFLNRRGRCFHVSQDRHQIFIIMAEYDENYMGFIDDRIPPDAGENSPGAFMTTHEYGPWNTTDPSHMRKVARILVAMALRAEADRVAEEASESE
ncbi:hypothetical protein BJX61DRAFT_552579 [Aspergillus egyptiacus]|nr:hypothetical protein BJX61DRAFT_552579 [Aspergillus egyptiacus]